MLGGVALHDELAELRAEVGPQVFDDPVAFRAAFDDFIPEGSASTGEVSLLVGAIATGALQRLKEQLAVGADPDMTIAVQGDLLARDRGTSETSGARWALSVLAHATGAIPVEGVLTRPTPGPDSGGTAERPQGAPPAPEALDPGPTRPVAHPPAGVPPTSSVDATRVVSQEPPAPATTPVAPSRRRTNPLLIATVAVLAVIAIAAIALLFLRDDESGDPADDGSSASDGSTDPEEVLAQIEMAEGDNTVRVQLVVSGTDASVVLLADQDGEYVEVDREPAGCPFLDTSYDAGIEDEGDQQLFWGWQNEGNEGFGAYGEVIIEDERLVAFDLGDQPCPDAR